MTPDDEPTDYSAIFCTAIAIAVLVMYAVYGWPVSLARVRF